MAKLLIVRHGNAIAIDGDEERRPLSPKGTQQGQGLQERLPELGINEFKIVVTSSKERAVDTGSVISGWKPQSIIKVPQLWTPNTIAGESMERMFRELGNEPLRAYFERYGDFARDVFFRFGREGWEAFWQRFHGKLNNEDDAGLGVGHGVYVPTMVWAACVQINNYPLVELALNTTLKECEGFLLELQNNEVVNVQRTVDLIPAST